MSGHSPQFAGTIPENYDRYLVPILFQSFAESMATKIEALNPRRVLELACGTGAVTKVLAAALPDEIEFVATDFSQDMLAIARQNLRDSRPIQWEVADACELPFDGDSFDLIVCQFGVMMFPDKLAAMQEAFRVLSSGGHLLYCTWGDIASNPFFGVIEDTLAELLPQEERPFMPTPMSMALPKLHREILAAAGFCSVEVETESQVTGPHEAASLAAGFAYGTPLGTYLSGQGCDLSEIQSGLTIGFEAKLGKPLFVSKQALVCRALKP